MPNRSYFINFDAALAKLVEFTKLDDGSEIHRAGIIQAFEFTFEQCWKAIQKKAGYEELNVASPKKALQWAMSLGWIETSRESIWLSMLADRNLTSHTYRDSTASEVAENVRTQYVPEFQALLAHMKKSS